MERMSVVFFLLLGSAAAQPDDGIPVPQVRVQVDFVNRVCDTSTHVTLMGRAARSPMEPPTIAASSSSPMFPQEATR